MGHYQLGSYLPFLYQVIEWVMAEHNQVILDEASAFDPFKSGFGLRFRMETALSALFDKLCLQLDENNS